MKGRNLQINPCWHAKDLGEPLPDSSHAVSVALPRWEDVIAYEEKDPHCLNKLKAIYPRFGFHPLIAKIAKKALELHGGEGYTCWPYPNIQTAELAKSYCQTLHENAKLQVHDVSGIKCLIVNPIASSSAKAFWQHTGLGASSRQAAIALKKERPPNKEDANRARFQVRTRLAEIYGCPTDLVQLYPSGMAALTIAIKTVHQIKGPGPVLQIGFPYVDVLKLPEKIFHGSELLIPKSTSEIEAALDGKRPSGIVVELPSNPMLQCIDLLAVSKAAKKRGIPLIVDDTIGSPINIETMPYADLIVSSLTKSFAGKGDVLSGSLVISPQSKWAKKVMRIIAKTNIATLSDPDSIALEEASRNVRSRIYQLNEACLSLKKKLETLKEVSRVLHPEDCQNFTNIMKEGGGYGCLLSFELKGGREEAKRVYNSLRVNKGPSLGTNFTLACPYVLLAHYQELDWAANYGVPSDLLRVSVGLENPIELWERFSSVIKK